MKKALLIPVLIILVAFAGRQAHAQWSYDSVSFETPATQIVIDPAGNNLWQVGSPQKVFFNSAHAGTKAILTDTLNPYPQNDTASFTYIIRDPYTKTCFTSMEFWHKYDMDSPGDRGIIDASYDGGNSWVIVSDTSWVSPWGSFFWWDQDFHEATSSTTNHNLDITGTSDGWIKSRFSWQWFIAVDKDTIIANPDSLMIRFTFISDGIETNKEGWMIDDILTSSAGWESCGGIKGNTQSAGITVFPNPFSARATVNATKVLSNATLTVYNSLGKIVQQQKEISGQTFTLSRENLPNGIYFIRLTDENKTIAEEKIFITD